MAGYYDRYSSLRSNGQVGFMPDVTINRTNTDLVIKYDKSRMRFDMLSYKYYGDPNYGWLLLLANKRYGSMEFSIPDGVSLIIPYPLSSAVKRYEDGLKEALN